jgi:hypothetical protein
MGMNGYWFTFLNPQAPPLSSGPAPLGGLYHVALALPHCIIIFTSLLLY